MALFQNILNKKSAPEREEPKEREYFKPITPQQKAASTSTARPEEKDMLRLIAVDASRKSDLHDHLRSCRVVGGESGNGYTLLLNLHDHLRITDSELIQRMRTMERRCGLVAHSRNIQLQDIYWAMPSTLAATAHSSGTSGFGAASQFSEFAPSQMGGASAFYPDASLVPWSAEDLPEIGQVKKAPPHIAPPSSQAPNPDQEFSDSLFGVREGKKGDWS